MMYIINYMAIQCEDVLSIFQAKYYVTEMDNIVGGRCSVSLITQLRRCIFSKNKNIFRHLKLEIALAIQALNDEKYNSNKYLTFYCQPITYRIWYFYCHDML